MQCSPQELKEKLLRHLDNDNNVSYYSCRYVLQAFISTCITIRPYRRSTIDMLVRVTRLAIGPMQKFAEVVYLLSY